MITSTSGGSDQDTEDNILRIRPYMTAGIKMLITFVELIQSFLTLQTVLVFGIVYWIGSVYLDYGEVN